MKQSGHSHNQYPTVTSLSFTKEDKTLFLIYLLLNKSIYRRCASVFTKLQTKNHAIRRNKNLISKNKNTSSIFIYETWKYSIVWEIKPYYVYIALIKKL